MGWKNGKTGSGKSTLSSGSSGSTCVKLDVADFAVENMVSADDEFRLFHPRKRRPSDLSVQTLLDEPLVHVAFKSFMLATCSEEFVSLWTDLYNFELVPYMSEEKRLRAQEIYSKYFAENAPQNSVKTDHLDSSTLVGLRNNLMVDENDVVNQTDLSVISETFKFIFAKVWTMLKFDFMPQFLGSDSFKELEVYAELGDGEVGGEKQMSMEAVLTNPYLLHDFLLFVNSEVMKQKVRDILVEMPSLRSKSRSDSSPRPDSLVRKLLWKKSTRTDSSPEKGVKNSSKVSEQELRAGTFVSIQALVELFSELEDFACADAGQGHRFERMKRILSRFGRSSDDPGAKTMIYPQIQFLHKHLCAFELKVGRYREIVYSQNDTSFFLPVREEILERLDKFVLPEFMNSAQYRVLQDRMDSSLKEFRDARAQAKIKDLLQYAEKRKIFDPSTYAYTLESAISLPWGAFYLKRFARKRLQEENVLFVLDVTAYQRMKEHCAAFQSQEDIAFVTKQAHRLCEMYIHPSSPLQINISHTQRSQLLEKVYEKGIVSPDVFDEARTETMRILNSNLWQQFQQDSMHENFIRKCMHNVHRVVPKEPGSIRLLASRHSSLTKRCSMPQKTDSVGVDDVLLEGTASAVGGSL
uniref:RGS domain-containing protein n=1 Tax=Mucochytrium quahogii TaxID=96639 RepID=A0A7S2WBK1_9STRA|mmetsp:Transcript_2421/g.4770  ORF Transcript_2421/g.4770 Transcript_2421/m.4770 type:complete len:638 (+) Transcript_2421:150-2063(+)